MCRGPRSRARMLYTLRHRRVMTRDQSAAAPPHLRGRARPRHIERRTRRLTRASTPRRRRDGVTATADPRGAAPRSLLASRVTTRAVLSKARPGYDSGRRPHGHVGAPPPRPARRGLTSAAREARGLHRRAGRLHEHPRNDALGQRPRGRGRRRRHAGGARAFPRFSRRPPTPPPAGASTPIESRRPDSHRSR